MDTFTNSSYLLEGPNVNINIRETDCELGVKVARMNNSDAPIDLISDTEDPEENTADCETGPVIFNPFMIILILR